MPRRCINNEGSCSTSVRWGCWTARTWTEGGIGPQRNTRACGSQADLPRHGMNKGSGLSHTHWSEAAERHEREQSHVRWHQSREAPQRKLQGLCKWCPSQFGRISSLILPEAWSLADKYLLALKGTESPRQWPRGRTFWGPLKAWRHLALLHNSKNWEMRVSVYKNTPEASPLYFLSPEGLVGQAVVDSWGKQWGAIPH